MWEIRKIILWTARVTFILSLFFLFFSIYQISISDIKITQSMSKWENKTNKVKRESPTTVINEERLKVNYKNVPNNQDSNTPPLYSDNPEKGDVFGKITIPSLNIDFPIIHGTDEKQLDKGVGHYIGSVLPGYDDNSVLAGHRDTVFRKLGAIKKNNMIHVQTTAGEFTYVVRNTQIVDQDNRTIIVPHDKAVLTLVTCYPFDYIGPAPKRFIVTAHLKDK